MAGSAALLAVAGWSAAALLGIRLGWVDRRERSRLVRLRALARQWAQGDLEAPPPDPDRFGRNLLAAAEPLREALGALTTEHRRWTAILDGMVEGVAVISPQERFTFCNPAFAQIWGQSAASYAGRPVVEMIRQPELLRLIRAALAGGAPHGEVTLRGDRSRSFSVNASAARGSGRGLSSAVVVLHDITELRRLEQVRKDFVANVSHEMRTPLTTLQGFAETLLAGALDDPEHGRAFVEIIRAQAERMGRLTRDLLQLAQIEAGALPMSFHPIQVGRLIQTCLPSAMPAARQRRLEITAEADDDLPPLQGDAHLLGNVIRNLLDNAIQYTSAGGRIQIAARAQGPSMVISVSDNGIGIPKADQLRIFERFYRVDAARSREAGGTGLGLSIARHIVEAHRGRIWAESTVGQGSTFYFSIPLAESGVNSPARDYSPKVHREVKGD